MSFEYIMDYPCKVRKKLGRQANDKIIEARKNMNKYLTICEQMKRTDPNADPDNMKIVMELQSPGGVKKKEVKAKVLKKGISKLEKFSTLCASCPCNLMGAFYQDPVLLGCYSTIKYPLSYNFELMLLKTGSEVFKQGKEGPAFLSLLMIWKNPEIGRAAMNMKKHHQFFFQSPQVPTVENEKGKRLMSSVQFIDLLFEANITQDPQKHLLLNFLKVLLRVHNQAAEGERAKGNTALDDDISLKGLLQYRQAIQLSLQHKCSIVTSM